MRHHVRTKLESVPKVPFDSHVEEKTYYMLLPDYWIKEGIMKGEIHTQNDRLWYFDKTRGWIEVIRIEGHANNIKQF